MIFSGWVKAANFFECFDTVRWQEHRNGKEQSRWKLVKPGLLGKWPLKLR